MTYSGREQLAAGVLDAPQARSGTVTFARVVFILFCIGLFPRILLSDGFLNLLYPYTTEGGNFAGKIHPGNYLMMICTGLIYMGPGLRFHASDLPLLRSIIVFLAAVTLICAFNFSQGRTGAAGYILDIYVTTGVAIVFVLAMPFQWRAFLGKLMIFILVVNAVLAMIEFSMGRLLIPPTLVPAEFRPTGFLGAALNAGVVNLTVAIMLIGLRAHWFVKLTGVTILIIGVFISGSRTAMLFSTIAIPLSVLVTAYKRREGFSAGVVAVLMVAAGIVIVPAFYMLASELGVLARFQTGYVDDSAQTRIDIYKVFGFVDWKDILFGANILEIRKTAQQVLGIEHIESPVIFFVFDMGLIGAVVFVGAFVILITGLSRKTHPTIAIGLVFFVTLAATNNTLSSKVPSVFVALMLAACLRSAHFVSGDSRPGVPRQA